MDSKNIKYLILTIILLILSGFGLYLIFKINPSPLDLISSTSKPTIIPTPIPQEIIPTKIPEIKITPIATVTGKIATPTPVATSTPKLISTIAPTPTASSSSLTLFKSTEDSFSVNHDNSRKVYQDKESTGNRYTFYSLSGNFAVHVAPSGSWSWTNTNRIFSPDFIVSGQNTFRYEINTQTIVDLQSSDKNYTLQCIHNGKESLKTECEAFLVSFKLL